MRHCDLTNMAASVSAYSWFVSVSRKVGSFALKSVFVAQAAARGGGMESQSTAKVSQSCLSRFKFMFCCVASELKPRSRCQNKITLYSAAVMVAAVALLLCLKRVAVMCVLSTAGVCRADDM